MTAFDSGRYLDSRELLERAHALSPNARTLRGMGLAAYEAERYALAIVDLSRALDETRQPLTQPQRAELKQLVREADAATARFRLIALPKGATLQLDGEPPVRDSDGHLLVDRGHHELVVRPVSGEPYTLELEARGGQRSELALGRSPQPSEKTAESLPPTAAELKSPAEVKAEPPAQHSSADPNSLDLQRSLAYAAITLATVTGGLTIWQWSQREREIDAWNDNAACLKRGRNRRANCANHERAYERAQTWAVVAGSATLALATGAVVLLMLEPARAESRPAQARCSVGVGSLQCGVAF